MSVRLIMKLTVESAERLSADVVRLAFRHPRRPGLPGAGAGAHVDVYTPGGVRQYSLCGDPADAARYVVAVKREADGRGGSHFLHDQVAAGDVLPVSAPRNHFPLDPTAGHHVLIGGGIGITPCLAMAHDLAAARASFEVHYAAADPIPAFRTTLERLAGPRAHTWRGSRAGGRLDVAALLAAAPAGAHVYCCGPSELREAVKAAAAGWDEACVHFEAFQPLIDPDYEPGPFELELASTGEVIEVPADRSALAMLAERGRPLPSSCEIGVCGSCECGYLAGEVVHRDVVLSPAARRTRLLPCVSRANGRLVLDL